jgi:hypothetical protein
MAEPLSSLGRGPLGGRHARARELATRRSRGEALGSSDSRALDAHLSACSRCRDWVAKRELQAAPWTVPGGQEAGAGATVGDMEAATSPGGGEQEGIGSREDAMGRDKRRQVVGHSYGPSKARQLAYYGIFVAFVVLAYIGARIAIDELDKAPKNNPDQAPWSKPDSPQTPPQRFQ